MERIKYTVRKHTRIFYISDFDSKGRDMPVSVARKVQFYVDDMDIEEDIKLYHSERGCLKQLVTFKQYQRKTKGLQQLTEALKTLKKRIKS